MIDMSDLRVDAMSADDLREMLVLHSIFLIRELIQMGNQHGDMLVGYRAIENLLAAETSRGKYAEDLRRDTE